jgi:hypothetical protein
VAKSIEARIKTSFPSPDSFTKDNKESLTFYLQTLMTTGKDYADGIRRSAALMLVLMAAFELLLRGAIKQTTIGPLVLSSTTSIEAFMPTGVAYFFYDALNCGINYEIVLSAYTAAFSAWNATAEVNDLDVIVRPRIPPYFVASGGSSPGISPFADLMSRIQGSFVVVILLGPALFMAYAFYQLSGLLHGSSVLLWVNIIISVLLLTIGYAQGFALAREA